MRRKQFVGEPILPGELAGDAASLARGEPNAPRDFVWRKTRYAIARVLVTEKSVRVDRGERYVARHWFTVETTAGERMRIYFDRQPGRGRASAARWYLYEIEEA